MSHSLGAYMYAIYDIYCSIYQLYMFFLLTKKGLHKLQTPLSESTLIPPCVIFLQMILVHESQFGSLYVCDL